MTDISILRLPDVLGSDRPTPYCKRLYAACYKRSLYNYCQSLLYLLTPNTQKYKLYLTQKTIPLAVNFLLTIRNGDCCDLMRLLAWLHYSCKTTTNEIW